MKFDFIAESLPVDAIAAGLAVLAWEESGGFGLPEQEVREALEQEARERIARDGYQKAVRDLIAGARINRAYNVTAAGYSRKR